MRPTKWRRRIVFCGAAVLLALVGAYLALTRRAVLMGMLSDQVGRAGLILESVGSVWFDPTRGVIAEDLRIRRRVNSASEARIPRLEIRLSIARLFTGNLSPTAIDLLEPALQFVRSPDESEDGWAPASFAGLTLDHVPTGIPPVYVVGGVVEVAVAGQRRPQVLRRWVVNARIEPVRRAADEPEALDFAIDQVGGSSVGESASGPRQLAWIRWEPGLVHARLGWVDPQWIVSMLPTPLAEDLRAARLKAHFRVDEMLYDAEGLRSASLVVREAAGGLPVEAPEALSAHNPPYLSVREGAAQFRFQRGADGPTRIDFEADVRMHDGTIAARGSASFGADSPETGNVSLMRVLQRIQDGDLGTYDVVVDARGISFPSADEHPAFIAANALPDPVRAFLRDYEPAGPLNLALRIRGDGHEKPEVSGVFEPVGAKCRYFRFPYQMEDVRGIVQITPHGMFLQGLNGRHGSGRIRADGRVDNSHKWTGFDLVFWATNLAMDADLYAAVPRSYQALWSQARPIGLSDVTVQIRRQDGSAREEPFEPEIEIDARLLAGSLDGPDRLRLTHADGLLHIAGGAIALDDFAGRDQRSPMSVEFSGRIEAPEASESEARYDLTVRAADLTFDRSYAVPDPDGKSLGTLRFGGESDAWGRIRSGAEGAESRYSARIRDGRVTGFDQRTSWDSSRGWVVLDGSRIRVLSLECGAGDRRVAVAGAIPGGASPGGGAIRLDSSDPQVASLLRGIVPTRWNAVREALGLDGSGTVNAEIIEPDEDRGIEGGARIGLKSAKLQPSALPLPLTDLTADVVVSPSGFEVPSATASYGPNGRIRLSGRGEWGRDQPTRTEFAIRGDGFSITPEFLDALPKQLAQVLRNLKASGDLMIDLDRLRMNTQVSGDWHASGRLEISRGALRAGLELTDVTGALWGDCAVRAGGELDLKAELSVVACRLFGRPAERWEGRILRSPGDRWLRLEGLRGRCCDGEMFGDVKFDVETSAYELSLTLDNVSLQQLFALENRGAAGAGRDRAAADGRVDGTVFLRGRGSEVASRVGGGELRVRSGSLLSLPATAPLVGAGPPGRGPRSGAVNEAFVQFAWMGDTLRLTRVDIKAADARLVGAGSWDLTNQRLDLTLLGARPENAPHLFPLTDLLDLANEELAQFRITGPVSDPQVRVELLHNVTEPLRKLFGGD